MVRAEAHVQEVIGLNPAVYWMDVSNASYYISNESNEKEKNKGRQMGHTKNKNKKIYTVYKVSFEYLPRCLFQNDEIDLEL